MTNEQDNKIEEPQVEVVQPKLHGKMTAAERRIEARKNPAPVAPEPEVEPEVAPEVAPEVTPEPEVEPEVAPEPEVEPEVAPEVEPEVPIEAQEQ